MKRFVCMFLCLTMVLTFIPNVSALNIEDLDLSEYGMGAEHVSVEESMSLLDENLYEALQMPGASNMPSAVDNSTSSYFPPIGNQGTQYSCVAWATTYYAYTYAVNKLHNTPANSIDNQYSPASTFNFLATSNSFGINAITACNYLMNHGAVTLRELPYNQTNCTAVASDEAMLRAMNTRVSNLYSYNIDANSIDINNTLGMKAVKHLLTEGEVFVTVMYFNEFQYGITSDRETVIYRNAKYESGSTDAHMLTIVGYDDNFSYDVNGDGTIEDAEEGAFKLANSWGLNNPLSENGYVWVLYDALKWESNISGDWEDFLNVSRVPAFSFGGNTSVDNWVYRFSVKDYTPMILAQANISINDRTHYTEYLARKNTASGVVFGMTVPYTIYSSSTTINRTLYYDYADLITPIDQYMNGISLYLWLSKDYTANGNNIINYARLVDNKNAEIGVFSSNIVDNQGRKAAFNLQYGDLNYDQIIDLVDAFTLYSNVSGGEITSNLVEFLSDVNQDGFVDMIDVSALYNAASGQRFKTQEEIA